jgi:hypothetical protein
MSKRVLVTGGSRFIGRSLCRELLESDYEKRSFDCLVEQVHRGQRAAEAGVGQSMSEIERYMGANEFGTAVLLQALVKAPMERILAASSMIIYGEGANQTPDGESVLNARRASIGTACTTCRRRGAQPHGSRRRRICPITGVSTWACCARAGRANPRSTPMRRSLAKWACASDFTSRAIALTARCAG